MPDACAKRQKVPGNKLSGMKNSAPSTTTLGYEEEMFNKLLFGILTNKLDKI